MIRYRLATAEDCPLLHQMLSEMAAADGAAINSSEASLRAHGFGPTPRFRAVLALETAPLGLCLFLPEYSTWRGELGVFVQDLYLRPAARGMGAGRALLAAAWTNAQDWQPGFMALMVNRANSQAIGFYQTLGFAPRDSADPYILGATQAAALNSC